MTSVASRVGGGSGGVSCSRSTSSSADDATLGAPVLVGALTSRSGVAPDESSGTSSSTLVLTGWISNASGDDVDGVSQNISKRHGGVASNARRISADCQKTAPPNASSV